MGALLHQPHHDGSDLYVLERPVRLGDRPSFACAYHVRRPPSGSSCATSATASRGTPRRSSTKRRKPTSGGAPRFRSQPDLALSLPALGRRRGLRLGERARDDRARGCGRRRFRDRSRRLGAGLAPGVGRLRDLPDRFARRGRRGTTRLGDRPRAGTGYRRPGPADAVRALRRRPARRRAAPRPHRVARGERDLPDAVLPRRARRTATTRRRSRTSIRCSAGTTRWFRSPRRRTRVASGSSAT